ncbi:hypothetical protein EVAR_20537_1 [Eumeta japonica]|uniref:Uncharacterized protein n=1 Tax=Eumeta variegata TaxID=151549 RepID=A0A4C1VKZ0_EUMVA|nr:hypothetical protein EVAR_20537_1 [Eumeta japonica]
MTFCRVEVWMAPACTQQKKQMTDAVHAGTPRLVAFGARLFATPTDGQDIIMYSDEFGSIMSLVERRRRRPAVAGTVILRPIKLNASGYKHRSLKKPLIY